MSMEKRLLVAVVASALILVIWYQLFPPPKPAPIKDQAAVAASGQEDASGAVPGEAPAGEVGEDAGTQGDVAAEAPVESVGERHEAESEQEVTLRNDVIEVVLTNRGAAIASLKLLRYESDEYDGKALELVQTVDDPRRTLPLQMRVGDDIDQRLYEVEALEEGFRFVWSDGMGNAAEKEIRLEGDGYGLKVSIARAGSLGESVISVGTGMRNSSAFERSSRLSQWGDAAIQADGDLSRHRRKKVKEELRVSPGVVSFVGFEDTYFLSVIRPADRVREVVVRPIDYVPAGAADDGSGEAKGAKEAKEGEEERILEVAVRPAQSHFEGELLSVPKEYDLLQAIGGGVEETIDFGVFNWFSVIFLMALRWIYGHVGNWGVAIMLLTLAIRIVLFPLMHKATVSTRRMAKVQPKVKAIQAKYKKAKSDPQARAKMSQETMELYREEGVNPVGGCLPMLVQLPILWALYRLFLRAIELRHAPFFLWITDLSVKDPYLITPILMTASMWLQQRLSPQVGDPQQQKFLKWMPLIFGVMFLQFPSGLVLYWLVNNVVGIVQQEVTLRLIGERGGSKSGGGKGRSQ